MAACGGLEHIFEKPLPETPTFLESLSPWKHIKPNIDDSSITEIFGELHFKENNHVHSSPSTSSNSNPTDAEEERERGRASGYKACSERKQYRHSESFSSESLSLCTEGLGFESFEDVEHDVCDKEWRDGDGDGERNVARNSHSDQNHRSEASRRSRRALPPPISCIGRCGTPGVCFRSFKEDGRFILREIRIPTQEFLHACRQDGRLKLQFVHNDDEILDDVDKVEVVDDVDEEDMKQEHHVESID